MIRDAHLIWAESQRPPGLALGIPTFIPFPDGFLVQGGSPKVYDCKTLMDIGRGYPLRAVFRITQSFVGAAGNQAAFAIGVADTPDMLTNPSVIASSVRVSTAGLTAGVVTELVVPSLSLSTTLGGRGRRYLCLGLEVTIAATDWTQGACDACLVLDNEGVVVNHPSEHVRP